MILDRKKLGEALERIAESSILLVPGVADGISKFVPWESGWAMPDTRNTMLPPKDILFPQTEKMYAYGSATGIREIGAAARQVVFGVRPCDMGAIGRLDRVFYEKGYVDGFYARKRENATFIAVACAAPGKDCFCAAMGAGPGDAPEADMLLVERETHYEANAQTEKGAAIERLWEDLQTHGATADGSRPEAPAFSRNVAMSDGLGEKLAAMFDHPIWERASRACIGCAVCTYVCPTCYCFDIGAMDRGGEGVAFRCWDSCMFSDYSRMAGGHDPRPTKKERLRNRYMHKLSYFRERYGTTLCTGCGRCVGKCPAHLDIAEFINEAAEAGL